MVVSELHPAESRVFITLEGVCPEPGCPGKVDTIHIGGTREFCEHHNWDNLEPNIWKGTDADPHVDGCIELKCDTCGETVYLEHTVWGDWLE